MNGLVGFLTENCRGRGASEQRRPPVLKRTSQRRSQGSARSRVAGQGIDKMSRKALAAVAMVALVGHAAWAGEVPFGLSADTVPMGVSLGVIHEKFGTPSFVGPIGPCGDRQCAHYDHRCFTETFSGAHGRRSTSITT